VGVFTAAARFPQRGVICACLKLGYCELVVAIRGAESHSPDLAWGSLTRLHQSGNRKEFSEGEGVHVEHHKLGRARKKEMALGSFGLPKTAAMYGNTFSRLKRGTEIFKLKGRRRAANEPRSAALTVHEPERVSAEVEADGEQRRMESGCDY